MSTVGSDFSAAPNTFAAPSRSCFLQSVIWFACTSYCCASSASVFSPLIAARATFALKAGLWFRRARLLIRDSPVPALMPISGRNSTYHPVQFCRATSDYNRRVCIEASEFGINLLQPSIELDALALQSLQFLPGLHVA